MKPFWCLLGYHELDRVAPLCNECQNCGQGFITDYFASRDQNRIVRIPVPRAEFVAAVNEARRVSGGWEYHTPLEG